MNASKNFPQALKAAMAKRGWGQKELADYLGVARSSVSNYLRGAMQPRPNQYEQFAELLGVSMDEIADLLAYPAAETLSDSQLMLTIQSILLTLQQHVAEIEDRLRDLEDRIP